MIREYGKIIITDSKIIISQFSFDSRKDGKDYYLDSMEWAKKRIEEEIDIYKKRLEMIADTKIYESQ